MTVKELKEKIKNLPDNMQVFMDERKTDCRYGLVNSARVDNVDFICEDFETVEWSEDSLILDEE